MHKQNNEILTQNVSKYNNNFEVILFETFSLKFD